MKTDAVMLNFCQWCKTRSSAFSQKFSATNPNFLHFFGRAPSRFDTKSAVTDSHPATQAASHVVVAITLYASRRAQKWEKS